MFIRYPVDLISGDVASRCVTQLNSYIWNPRKSTNGIRLHVGHTVDGSEIPNHLRFIKPCK